MKEILHDVLRASDDLGSDHLVIVSNVEPEKVEELQEDEELRGVKFVRGDYYSELSLQRANVREARKVVIIADTLESSAVSEVDSKTVMAVLTAKSLARDVYVTAELRKDTPVDTGWARANWIPQVDSPFTGVDGTRTRGAISTSAQAAGTAQAAAFNIKKDTVIFITNNVPYIKKLNAGSSQQAPALFIESAVANAVNKSK